jgi:hypothetical protein
LPCWAFNIALPEGPFFELLTVTPSDKPLVSERAMTMQLDGGLELLGAVDKVARKFTLFSRCKNPG